MLPTSGGGGGLTHLAELLRAAQPGLYGIDRVTLWSGRATLAQIQDRPWLTKAHDPILDRPLPFRLVWQRFVLPTLAPRHCDLLLVPGGSFRPTSLPVVTMCQNMLPFQAEERARYSWSPMRLKLELLALSQRQAFREANGVIYLTRFAQQTVERIAGIVSPLSAVIPHGINDSFRAAPRTQQPLAHYSEQRPFRLLYVSIVTVYKHQGQVAQAVASLRNAGLPIAIDFIGSAYAPALVKFNSILERVDPERTFVRYCGEIPYRQLPSYYQQADAFIFASSCENLPNILLEAMAAGLPIACSDREPMPETLGPAGVYFDPEDVSSIAEAIKKLLVDVELRQRVASEAHALSHAYTWETAAHATFKFVQQAYTRWQQAFTPNHG